MIKKLFFALSLGFCGLLGAPAFSAAQEIPFFRDFVTFAVPPPGRLEISADYLLMNDAIDLFDFREREIGSAALDSNPVLGDLQGARLLVNYGLFGKTGLHAAYSRTEIEAGPVEFSIDSVELYLRRQLWAQNDSRRFGGSLDIGGRFNRAPDRTIDHVSDINTFVKRIDPQFSVEDTGSHIEFSDGQFLFRAVKEGRPPLAVALEDLQDYTAFVRLTAGRFFDGGGVHLFAELGHTEIDSKVDSNIQEFIPFDISGQFESFPIELDRDENYWKAGLDFHLDLPYEGVGNLRYEYLRLDRDNNVDFIDYNHVVKGDLVWPINDRWAVDLGATYLRRQFNGIVPFMYNRFTKTTFDHDYGFVHFGVIARLP